jgi:D-alanyl-D-alanine carboxypeptidase (penicillin-binding protein 5/6)
MLKAVIGGRTRSRNLHFAPGSKRRAPWRLIAVIIVLLVLVLLAGVVKAAAATPPQLTVKQVLPGRTTFPGPAPQPAWPSSGQAAVEVEGLPPIGSSGSGAPLPIASLAKIMTAYVVLQDHPLAPGQSGFTTTVGAAAVTDYEHRAAAAESVVAVSAGETLNEAQLLEGLLVPSGNNFATLLADYDAGTVTAFVAKMQSTARRLGMAHTTYTDPSGLAGTTVSTATDQLVLAERAMAIPVFARTVALTSVTLPVAGQLSNFLKPVGTGGYVGIKTGSDSTAGGCLVFANQQTTGGHTYTILGAVLGQDKGDESTTRLIRAVQQAADTLVHSIVAAVRVQTVVPAGTVTAVVQNAEGRRVPVTTTAALSRLGYGGMAVPLSVSFEPVGRSLHGSQTVAHVSVVGGDTTAASASTSMPEVSFTWKLTHDY